MNGSSTQIQKGKDVQEGMMKSANSPSYNNTQYVETGRSTSTSSTSSSASSSSSSSEILMNNANGQMLSLKGKKTLSLKRKMTSSSSSSSTNKNKKNTSAKKHHGEVNKTSSSSLSPVTSMGRDMGREYGVDFGELANGLSSEYNDLGNRLTVASVPPNPQRPFQCPECQKCYPHSQGLYQHRFKIHGFRARRDRAPGERGPSAEVLDKARGVLANNMSLVPSGGGSLMEE